MRSKNDQWWSEEYAFFGDFYMKGDDSKEGYLAEAKQNLQERTKAEVDGIVRLLRLEGSEKILDIPCGYGRHSIELSKRGYRVTGSDINTAHLSKAKSDAQKEGVVMIFQKENMLDIIYDEEFDAIINMFYSFGFFVSDKDNFKALQNFCKALKPGGKFLMHTDVNIPRIIAGMYKENEVRHLRSGHTLHIIDKYNQKTKRIDGSWEITDGDRRVKKQYSMRVYTKEEFIDLCTLAGFRSCEACSDWKGEKYNSEGEDMMIVASK